METLSRLLPLSAAHIPEPFRTTLLSSSPVVFEENLPASYILRQPSEYVHNATRAAIALTSDNVLVVVAMGSKKIDVRLDEPSQTQRLSIRSDNKDRIVFKIQLEALGPGTRFSSLEIKARTKMAGKIVEVAGSISSKLME